MNGWIMSRRPIGGGLLGVAAVLLFACGGGGTTGSNSSNPPQTTVKIACDRELSEVFLWDLGSFSQKYGISPQCVQIQSFNESLQAVSNGSVDVGVLGIPQMSTVASKGLPLKVVAGYTNAGQNIVIKNGETITTWSDFQGKTICVPQGTGTAIMVSIALEQQHVDISKVKIQGIGFVTSAALQAVQSGQCDGLGYWSPVTDQAVQQNIAHYATPGIDINTATTIQAANGVMVANSSLYGNKSLIDNFMKAYVESMNYYTAHPDKWASVGAQVTGADQALLAAALKHQEAVYNVDVAAAQAAAAYGPQFGFATTDASAQIPGIVDVSALAVATGKSASELTQPVPWTGS